MSPKKYCFKIDFKECKNKIAAIRGVRIITGMGLKQAKDLVCAGGYHEFPTVILFPNVYNTAIDEFRSADGVKVNVIIGEPEEDNDFVADVQVENHLRKASESIAAEIAKVVGTDFKRAEELMCILTKIVPLLED